MSLHNRFEIMIILFCTLLLFNCQSRQTGEKGNIAFNLVDSAGIDSVVDSGKGVGEVTYDTSEGEGKIHRINQGTGQEQADGEMTIDDSKTRAEVEIDKDSSSAPVDEAKSERETPMETYEEGGGNKEEAYPAIEAFDMLREHEIWDDLLKKYVDPSGKVDYDGFVRDRQVLEQYLDQLSTKVPTDRASKSEQLAYWINAYNAYTVYLIVRNYPVKSILDLYDGKPWDHKWIEIGSDSYSLNDIEHTIIRKRYADPRIHFAVNCASKSCPPLASTAFTSENYEELANRLTRQFINDPDYNRISSNNVELSRIFEWYSSDFGDLIAFLNRYSQKQINTGASISYLDYDWNLNVR